jgi:hypothetical protein
MVITTSFDTSSQSPQLLSLLVASQLPDQTIAGGAFELHITLKPFTTITLHDDLEKLNYASVTMTVTLEHKSTLTYIGRVVASERTMLAGQALISTLEDRPKVSPIVKNVRFIFAQPEAHADITYTYLVGREHVVRLKTLQDHISPSTTSTLIVKGAFEDKAQFFCDNLIHIHKGADRVHAEQVNKNLLLSDKARAVSIPRMEVEAHEVSCKHGAATSKLSPEHLFYMQSRGMDAAMAQEMLISAFLQK